MGSAAGFERIEPQQEGYGQTCLQHPRVYQGALEGKKTGQVEADDKMDEKLLAHAKQNPNRTDLVWTYQVVRLHISPSLSLCYISTINSLSDSNFMHRNVSSPISLVMIANNGR